MASQSIVIRPPSVTNHDGYQSPSLSFLLGTWHVTHSTLPMWRSKRNVKISYAALPASSSFSVPPPKSGTATDAAATDRLDDTVTYQGLTSTSLSTVCGVDTAADPSRTDAWNWRGKGWLKIASSHWEVLGWGSDDSGNEWVVSYFGKTLFTPAGIDFYSRDAKGLSESTMLALKEAVGRVQNQDLSALAKGIFEVKIDDGI